jgi:ankyrin repeat protein
VLKDIKKQNRGHARRLLQCLVVAIRPLRIEELAEVLAVDFDDTEGTPKLKPDWRWEDHEQALLSSCSSLIAIVKTDDSQVVQFSHFSVKEFLTSARLATSKSEDVSRYHIDLEPAHTILAQACLSILLQSIDRVEENDVGKSSPLAVYAAQYWVIHAQFKEVSSCLRKAMGYLFDPDKPYFAAWLQLHNIDSRPGMGSSLRIFTNSPGSDVSPLYCAALCGFLDLVEDLVIKYPQDVNARSGCCVTPLVAALAGGHSQTAKYLYDNGAHLNIPDNYRRTPLHCAAWYGDLEMVQVLLDYKADINARSKGNWTPLHYASDGSFSRRNIRRLPDVAQLLLEHGADVNAPAFDSLTPLHEAARNGRVGVVRLLLEHGANVGAEDEQGRTPLHAAVEYGSEWRETERAEVVSELLEHGANVDVKDNKGRTPFQIGSAKGSGKIVKLLSEYGATVSKGLL